MTPIIRFLDQIAAQRGTLFPFLPVFFAIGIGIYFGLPTEPEVTALWYAGAGSAVLALVAYILPSERIAPLFTCMSVALLGFALAGHRAHSIAEPVLGFRYYGPIEGRIVAIDQSASEKTRLTLDQVILRNVAPEKIPKKVRVSLHGQQGFFEPRIGMRVFMTGHLAPPNGPVEPGGFDFQRMAWFDQLGAVGYTRSPALMYAPPPPALGALGLSVLRLDISSSVQAQMPGEAGAFAAAIMTGDRSGMSLETQENLRASNLSHLLAISGLHMGLLTGVVYSALRYLLALFPYLALRFPIKKFSAVGALLAATFYLALSGGNVATERAFIMAAVMYFAVMLERRAISLRAVAIAALIVLAFRPEVLAEPGFQMSFAATVALVAAFGWMRKFKTTTQRIPRLLRPAVAVLLSSAVAGLATAPVAAAHFNRIADYGLIANLVSVPLMGAVVMPAAVFSAVLSPFGWEAAGLWIMKPAIEWILAVADRVASLEGALTYVHSPAGSSMPLIALGGLWLVLWNGRARLAGLALLAVGFATWTATQRPAVLISGTGGLVGVWSPQGRVLSKPKGEGYSADTWLENDGDGADQIMAAARNGLTKMDGETLFVVDGHAIAHVSGRKAADRVDLACRHAELVILAGEALASPACRVIDRVFLKEHGAVAIKSFSDETGWEIETARSVAGARLWNSNAADSSKPKNNRGLLSAAKTDQ